MSRTKILIQGSLIRAGYGVAAMAFPQYLSAAVGLRDLDPQARLFNRLLGGRDLALAGSTVVSAARGEGAAAARANLLAETADSAALISELKDRGKVDRVLVIGLALNAVGYVTWIRALRAGKPEKLAEQLIEAAAEEGKRQRRLRTPKLAAPRVSTPSLPKVSAPSLPHFSAPSLPQVTVPQISRKQVRKLTKRAKKALA